MSKILFDEICSILHNDYKIDDFDFYTNNPYSNNKTSKQDRKTFNKSKYIYESNEHKLALQLDEIPDLYTYAKKIFVYERNKFRKFILNGQMSYISSQENSDIDFTDFISLLTIQNSNTTHESKLYVDDIQFEDNFKPLLDSTMILCLINSDFNDAWNQRKLVISNLFAKQFHEKSSAKNEDISKFLQVNKEKIRKCFYSEIRFLNLVLKRQSKSGAGQSHRRQLLTHFGLNNYDNKNKSNESIFNKPDIIETELKFCLKLSHLYPKNYYVWDHRHWCIKYVNSDSLILELNRLIEQNETHISDSSGFHYRQKLLSYLYQDIEQREEWFLNRCCSGIQDIHIKYFFKLVHRFVKVLEIELTQCQDLIDRYLAHESLQIYARSLFRMLLQTHTQFFNCSKYSIFYESCEGDLITELSDNAKAVYEKVEYVDEDVEFDYEPILCCQEERIIKNQNRTKLWINGNENQDTKANINVQFSFALQYQIQILRFGFIIPNSYLTISESKNENNKWPELLNILAKREKLDSIKLKQFTKYFNFVLRKIKMHFGKDDLREDVFMRELSILNSISNEVQLNKNRNDDLFGDNSSYFSDVQEHQSKIFCRTFSENLN